MPAKETEYGFLSRTEGLGRVEVAEGQEEEAAGEEEAVAAGTAAAAATAGSEAAEVVAEAAETAHPIQGALRVTTPPTSALWGRRFSGSHLRLSYRQRSGRRKLHLPAGSGLSSPVCGAVWDL